MLMLSQVYQSLVSKRLEAGEDPFPITFCQRVPTEVFEQERSSAGMQGALNDLLRQIVDSRKMSDREKRRKLRGFKEAHPEVYASIFPSEEHEPRFMRGDKMSSSITKLPTFSKIRSVMRI